MVTESLEEEDMHQLCCQPLREKFKSIDYELTA